MAGRDATAAQRETLSACQHPASSRSCCGVWAEQLPEGWRCSRVESYMPSVPGREFGGRQHHSLPASRVTLGGFLSQSVPGFPCCAVDIIKAPTQSRGELQVGSTWRTLNVVSWTG